jgi:hypothetical protein
MLRGIDRYVTAYHRLLASPLSRLRVEEGCPPFLLELGHFYLVTDEPGQGLGTSRAGPSSCVTHPLSRPRLALAPGVPQERSFQPVVRPAVGALLVVGAATLPRLLASLGRHQQDGSADYQFPARADGNEQNLLDALRPSALAHCSGRFVPVALDDTRLRKTGQRLPTAFWQRDPLSPPFRVNLPWGRRF